MYTTRHEVRIADFRQQRDRCMRAARIARVLQSDDLATAMVCEARDLHQQLVRVMRQGKHVAA